MKYLNWSTEKNEILKRERGISFEEIACLIESGNIIGIEENVGRPGQKIFLKIAFPSREYTKKIRNKGGIMKKTKRAFEPIGQEEKELMASIEQEDW